MNLERMSACMNTRAKENTNHPHPNEIHTLRGLGWFGAPLTLAVSILPCNLQYLVKPTLKNTS